MAQETYRVVGMTCEHCVAAVSEEVALLPGVTSVQVDLDGGALVVDSEHDLARQVVADAVDEAGYTLVDA